jgi:hypothetical protein
MAKAVGAVRYRSGGLTSRSSRNSGDAGCCACDRLTPRRARGHGAEPSVPTLAAQTPLRVSYRKAAARPMYPSGLRPLHLSGTRLEGGHRRLFPSLRFVGVEPTKQRRFGCRVIAIVKRSNVSPVVIVRARQRSGEEVAQRAGMHAPARLPCRPASAATLTATALRPADRIVVRDLGVHPRGEFRTSGAAVGQ